MSTAGQSFSFLTKDGLASLRMGGMPAADVLTGPMPKRQRAKLWELNNSVHCSIIGTCLTTGELRRAMAKVTPTDVSHVSDHDLHSRAVGLCGPTKHVTGSGPVARFTRWVYQS